MIKDFKINLGDLKIHQLGFVFKDIEKQASIMETLYNIPKFTKSEVPALKVNYRGKESIISQKYAFSKVFDNLQIELIQWIDGDCIYPYYLTPCVCFVVVHMSCSKTYCKGY